MESPIPIPPEAGLEIREKSAFDHEGLEVNWLRQNRASRIPSTSANITSLRTTGAELDGTERSRKVPLRKRILQVQRKWLWVIVVTVVVLITGAIIGGVVGGLAERKRKEMRKNQAAEKYISSPCQNDVSTANKTILSAYGINDTNPFAFRLVCGWRLPSADTVVLMSLWVPDMANCMAACLDYDETDTSCYMVMIERDTSLTATGQQSCNLLTILNGTDIHGVASSTNDCAIYMG